MRKFTSTHKKSSRLAEALARSASGQDAHDQAMTSVLKKLIGFKTLPFFNKMDTDFRNAIDQTGGIFQDNDLPEDTQKLWVSMVNDLAQAISTLGMIAASYAVSKTDPDNIEPLKQKAIARFNSVSTVPQVNKTLQQLKAGGVDITGYEKILNDGVKQIVDGIFDLDANGLTTLTNALSVSPEMKKQLNTVIQSNRKILTGTTNRTMAAIPSAKGSTGAKVEPEVAQQISTNFRKYMDTLKNQYGVQSLELLNQEIQTYLQNTRT